MPFKRGRLRTYVKKKPIKRGMRREITGRLPKGRSMPSTTMVRGTVQRSDKTTVKLVYTDRITFGSSDDQVQVYRGAGAYSPKVGTSVSPAGWSNYSDFYEYYYCSSSKVSLQLVSTGAGTNLATACQVVLIPYNSSHVGTDIDTFKIADEPYARAQIVGGAGGTTVKYMRSYMSYKKMQGKSKKCELQDDYYAHSSASAVPYDDWYWHIFASSVGDTTMNQLVIFVKITYYVTFYTRKDVVGAGPDDQDTNYVGVGETGSSYIFKGRPSD